MDKGFFSGASILMKRFSSIMRVLAISAILLASIWMAIFVDTRLQSAPEETPLVQIKNIQTLRTQFNRDAGKTRLIILVAPT
jgi:hypothetical protein